MNISAIISGWGKAMGVLGISEQEQVLSNARMIVCSACDESKESSFLEFLSTGPENIQGLYCNVCKCPCHQKSLTNDLCPLGKWNNIK